jgi:hypothetical protein
MAKVMIYWDVKIQAYQLKMKTDFDRIEKVVNFLKATIPHSDRSWDPNTKTWTFIEKYLDGVEKLCKVIYGNSEVAVLTKASVEGQTKNQAVASQTISGTDATLLEFMKLLPYEAAQKAYKAACFVLHPDRGGNMEAMSKLNASWQKIEREVYHQ